MATPTRAFLSTALRQQLREARLNTDALFGIVRENSLYERPIPERHRIIFYLGHLEAFDLNLFRENGAGPGSSHPDFDRLFAFGIDPLGGGLPTDRSGDWPVVEEVRTYRDRVREEIDSYLDGIDFAENFRLDGAAPGTLLHVAIEHRLMHAETLAYMFHRLPVEKKYPQRQAVFSMGAIEPRMLKIPAGKATLGLPRNAHGPFGWDNEFEAMEVPVPAFQIDKYMVTNAEYVEFLEAGGYSDPTLWPAEDWAWKEEQKIKQPAFWELRGRKWFYRAMFQELPLIPDWPVYVSHAEASAFARWAKKSLPTEAQWHRAAYGATQAAERAYPWGESLHNEVRGNFDFSRWDPVPVNAFPENESAFGVAGQIGNGWEWTSSLFEAFPDFEPFPFYPGYSANFFDGKHYVLKGGSSRTAASMLRRSFRNWFQPHYQYVYAGFRCVAN
jgi:gamma-glutamyl hercynylcysteine S-oxide synthase